MNIKNILMLIFLLVSASNTYAQNSAAIKDSLYIQEVEELKEPAKVLHAEPLYIDLIRDLGARKGEKEWNIGLGLTDNQRFDSYEALVEYEWAPIDRLGLEVELPFTIYSPLRGVSEDSVPSDRLNSIKLAAQWTFLVNEPMATSMAIGYINEFELSDFRSFGSPLIKGNVYNPFFVVAKRWGNNYHSLIYTGPMIEQNFQTRDFHTTYDINTSFHYMIAGTRNFIGVEFNKTFDKSDFDMTIRPQMRLSIVDNLLIGIVTGIPVKRENERFSSFVRLIWEPGHKKTHKFSH
ncbi:phosphoribosylformylglycinamidine synthase [Pontibacter diazotrophicus]|uniref:Phosphoribosylformylglycinamidine synthase n=1 Tax=Pontibacter diazotrophicus TaxID=1400979 RepID=A0A3D8LDD1_9BACT|nr:HAEPLYID family protein [Pontibacter diazotrophicus]RDV15415.1 phosphoribosylformylglycinamidine synthase [Pontibacter diazotrophicus]